jgi:hypothetical protein
MRAGLIASILAVGVLTTEPVRGIYIGVETRRVPVARLVANLEKQLASSPKSADIHLRLARLYGMAYAVNAEEVPVTTRRDGTDEVWFGHEPNLVPHRSQSPAEGSRTAAGRDYLSKAVTHYRQAVALDPESLPARLGLGWTLEQSGDKAGAIEAYRAVIARAWPKEQGTRMAELGQRFYTLEAAEYLAPLLDPKADAAEISELGSRMQRLAGVPRPITPIAVPLQDASAARSLVDLDAQVRFDADGSGRLRSWTWISADAGWLVYDAEGKGVITSALQWFGNVTFWLMWTNGYEALGALDDNADGELTGSELRHLSLWHDRDRDGVSDPGEVKAVAQHGIVAISCRFVPADGVFAVAASASGVRFADGRSRPTYDVILRPSSSVSAPAPAPTPSPSLSSTRASAR